MKIYKIQNITNNSRPKNVVNQDNNVTFKSFKSRLRKAKEVAKYVDTIQGEKIITVAAATVAFFSESKPKTTDEKRKLEDYCGDDDQTQC